MGIWSYFGSRQPCYAMEQASTRLVQTFLTCAKCEARLLYFTSFDKYESSFILVITSTACFKTDKSRKEEPREDIL